MPRLQISVRSSAIIMLTRLWLHCHINHIAQCRIIPIKQTIFRRVPEVDKPLVSLLLSGLFSQGYISLCITSILRRHNQWYRTTVWWRRIFSSHNDKYFVYRPSSQSSSIYAAISAPLPRAVCFKMADTAPEPRFSTPPIEILTHWVKKS